MSSFTHIGIFNTYIVNIREVITSTLKRVTTDKMGTYYSLNKQYMKRDTKMDKKDLLFFRGLPIWLYILVPGRDKVHHRGWRQSISPIQ